MNLIFTIFEIGDFVFNDSLRFFLDFSGHFLTGLVLASILYRNKSIFERIALGFIGGFLPDFDFFLQIIGVMEHGTLSHTPLIVIPILIFGIFFYSKPFKNKHFYNFLLFMISLSLLHILADMGSNYLGQMLYLFGVGVVYVIWIVVKKKFGIMAQESLV